MEVVLPKSGETEETEEEKLTEISGALYRPGAETDDPDLYILQPLDKLHLLQDEEDSDLLPMHIVAMNEARVLKVLQHRYPAPAHGSTMVLRLDEYETKEPTQDGMETYRRRRRCYSRHKTYEDVFVVLRRPLFDTVHTISQLQTLSEKHGAFYITKKQYNDIFRRDAETAAAAGFVTALREKLALWQVNFNEEVLRKREYREKLAAYKDRMDESMPGDILYDLYAVLTPSNWPTDHPGENVVCGKALVTESHGGWGNSRRVGGKNSFSSGQVVDSIKLTRRLYGKPWWREVSTNSYYNSGVAFKSTLEQALQHIHGIEASFDARFGKLKKDVPRCHPDVYLCRWLRAEARAMKIKIPPKPVKPLSPVEQRAVVRAQKKRRRDAQRQKKKENA